MANSFLITANANPAPPSTRVFVTNATANVGENIEISVNISDVEKLTSMQVKLWWDRTTLEYVDHTVTIPVETFPGGVLHEPSPVLIDSVNQAEGTYLVFAAFTPEAPGDPIISFNGSGSVFTMRFKVLRDATTYLHLVTETIPKTELVSFGEFIEFEAVDGKFNTPNFVDEWAPFANFTRQPDIVFVNREVTFNASKSYDPDQSGYIDLYMWNLGDGTQVNTTDPILNHTYTQQQTVLVTLVVRDNRGCLSYPVSDSFSAKTFIDIAIENVTIADSILKPGGSTTIDVTLSNLGDETVWLSAQVKTFYNETPIDSNNPDAANWTLIGEQPSGIIWLGSTKTLIFNWDTSDVTQGRYYKIKANFTLTGDDVENNNQKISDDSVYLEVPPVADFHFSPSTPVENEIITFDASASYDPDGSITLYEWDFGDGTTATGIIANHSYSQSGPYNVTLTVTDDDGNNNSTTKTVGVGIQPPIASFTYSPTLPVEYEEITFNASTSYSPSGAKIVRYTWDFGDGTILSFIQSVNLTDTVTHAYLSDGTFVRTIELTVEDEFGLIGTTFKSIAIFRGHIEVEADVGTMHFRGELAEFYVLVKFLGKPTDATEPLNATLYYAGTSIQTLTAAKVDTGLYRILYGIPNNASSGTYTLVVEASVHTMKGSTLKSFQVSSTLTEWNAWLKEIKGDIATIVIPNLGLIEQNLTAINAKLVGINGTVGIINSTVGEMTVDLATLDTTITGLFVDNQGELFAKIDYYLGSEGTITTRLEDLNAVVERIEGNVITIKTDVGTIKIEIGELQTATSDAQAAASNSIYTISIFTVIAIVLSFVTFMSLRRKRSK